MHRGADSVLQHERDPKDSRFPIASAGIPFRSPELRAKPRKALSVPELCLGFGRTCNISLGALRDLASSALSPGLLASLPVESRRRPHLRARGACGQARGERERGTASRPGVGSRCL